MQNGYVQIKGNVIYLHGVPNDATKPVRSFMNVASQQKESKEAWPLSAVANKLLKQAFAIATQNKIQ